jgi:hypothetical protein
MTTFSAGSARELIRVNIGPEDSLVINDESGASLFDFRGWNTARNYVKSRGVLDPLNTPAFGAVTRFITAKQFDRLSKVQLITTVGALTVTGASTFKCFDDYAGFWLVDDVTIRHVSSVIQSFSGEYLYLKHRLKAVDTGSRAMEASLAGGDLPFATRVARAAGAQTFITDLRPFWDHSTHTSLPILGFADDIQIQVTNRTLSRLCQHDVAGTLSCPITSQQLKVLVYHTTGDERAEDQLELRDRGRVHKYLQPLLQSDTVSAGLSTKNIAINAIRHPVSHLIIISRPVAADSGNPLTNDLCNFTRLASVRVTLNGIDAFAQEDDNYMQNHIRDLYFSGSGKLHPGDNIYVVPHSVAPEDESNCCGTLNYGVAYNPTLLITYPAALAADESVRIYGVYHAFNQIQSGDIVPIFT